MRNKIQYNNRSDKAKRIKVTAAPCMWYNSFSRKKRNASKCLRMQNMSFLMEAHLHIFMVPHM